MHKHLNQTNETQNQTATKPRKTSHKWLDDVPQGLRKTRSGQTQNQHKERNHKDRAEIKETKMKGTIQRTNKAESWVSEEGNTMDKVLAKLSPKGEKAPTLVKP